jgi:TRAP-type C4-dicarboxylate transport system permease small subunit
MGHESTVRYSTSKRKVYAFAVTWIAATAGLAWLARNHQDQKYLFLALIVGFGLTGIFFIRRVTKDAHCTNCQGQLYEIIEAAQSNKLNFNYCPNCGTRLRIKQSE